MQAASLDATPADLAIEPGVPDQLPAGSPPAVRTAAAERMRRHRERRRLRVRCVTVVIVEKEVDELVRRELLPGEMRNDACAIAEALHHHFDRTLNPPNYGSGYK
jgi:hypothetical protein